jgi:hypothetical protein
MGPLERCSGFDKSAVVTTCRKQPAEIGTFAIKYTQTNMAYAYLQFVFGFSV